MKLAWTTYSGDPATLPPMYERVLVLIGDYKDLAVLYSPMESGGAPFWHSGNGYTRELAVGQRWLRWPSPEIMESVGQVVSVMRQIERLLGQLDPAGASGKEGERLLTLTSRLAQDCLANLDQVDPPVQG